MKNKFYLFSLIFLLLLIGCTDKTTGPEDPPPNVKKGILVVNEGLFAQNNSSLTFISLDDYKLYPDVYKASNDNNSLGDTANDLYSYEGKAYITVDLSNKIEVVDLNTFVSEGFIDLGSNAGPREVIIMNKNEGYVTSGGRDAVIKFNPETKTQLIEIKVGSRPEGIEFYQDRIFAANSGFGSDSTVSIIRNDEKVEDIVLWANPRIILKDNDFIYVVCSGNYFDAEGTGAVFKINPLTYDVIQEIKITGNPGESVLSGDGYMYIVNNEGIIKLDLNTFKLIPNYKIEGTRVNPAMGIIYSISYDFFERRIIAGNPKDFMQNGEVVIFEENGTEVARFDTGINPGTIYIIDQIITE